MKQADSVTGTFLTHNELSTLLKGYNLFLFLVGTPPLCAGHSAWMVWMGDQLVRNLSWRGFCTDLLSLVKK